MPEPTAALAAPAAHSDRVREILTRLVAERQELRRSAADAATLEANRLAIVYWQSQLRRSLIQENVSPAGS